MKRFITYLSSSIGTCLLMWLILYFTCRYSLCLREDIGSFFFDSGSQLNDFSRPGGVALASARLFVQFFTAPVAAVTLTTLLLTAITALSYLIARKISGTVWVWPMALAPGVLTSLLLCDTNYSFAAVSALAIALLFLSIHLYINRFYIRLMLSIGGSLILLWTCGSVAMLYAVAVVIIECSRDIRRGGRFLSCPLALTAASYFMMRAGIYPDLWHALSPISYYTAWREPTSMVWLPWCAIWIIIVVSCFVGRKRALSRKGKVAWLAIQCVGIVAIVVAVLPKLYCSDEQHFAEFAYYTGTKDWDRLIERSKGISLDDTRLQCCLNLALAEKGTLADRLFHHPNKGPESICPKDIKDPMMFMVLSDVYFSMGHISLAQRLAFEANEAFGNFSPRLLQRLVDTSLIYRQYALADKYLSLLDNTLCYREWAAERRRLLYDDNAVSRHKELGSKSQCILPDDRFAEAYGIDDDLRHILLANPQHSATMHYLGSLCLLEKNIPKFTATMDQFYGSGLLTDPLPCHFQEGLAVAAFATGQPLDIRYRLHPSVMQRCKAFWADRQPQPNTCWHYLKNTNAPAYH